MESRRPRRPVRSAARPPRDQTQSRSGPADGRQGIPARRDAGGPRFAAAMPVAVVSALDLAVSVVGRVDREHPADSVLRATLRDAKGVGAEEAGETARLVFGYYRWLGMVGPGMSVAGQIEEAAALARRFAEAPESFDEVALQRAVPGWVEQAMEVQPAWLRALQREPRLWLRARPGSGAALALELGDAVPLYPELLPDALLYRGARDLFRTRPFHEGRFELQDLSSQMVGALCAPQPGETWHRW